MRREGESSELGVTNLHVTDVIRKSDDGDGRKGKGCIKSKRKRNRKNRVTCNVPSRVLAPGHTSVLSMSSGPTSPSTLSTNCFIPLLQSSDISSKTLHNTWEQTDSVLSVKNISGVTPSPGQITSSQSCSSPSCRSPSTGLLCLTVTSNLPIPLVTRQSLVRYFGAGLIIINSVGTKTDKLELGLELENERDLSGILEQAEKDSLLHGLTIQPVATVTSDPFSWVTALPQIPKVNSCGLYQLIVRRVNLSDSLQSSRSTEATGRSQLASITTKLQSVFKVVHGEGESVVSVGNMVQAVVYTSHINSTFPTKLQCVWQPKVEMSKLPRQSNDIRYYLVSVRNLQYKDLSPLQHQVYAHHHLVSLGRVLQLDQGIFGASSHFLAVFQSSKSDAALAKLVPELDMLELGKNTLNQRNITKFRVDSNGFYVVVGKFPEDITKDAKERFTKDMMDIGAVGFKKGETEHSFALQFVNSACLVKVKESSLFRKFDLLWDCIDHNDVDKSVLSNDRFKDNLTFVGKSCEEICQAEDANVDKDVDKAEKLLSVVDKKSKDIDVVQGFKDFTSEDTNNEAGMVTEMNTSSEQNRVQKFQCSEIIQCGNEISDGLSEKAIVVSDSLSEDTEKEIGKEGNVEMKDKKVEEENSVQEEGEEIIKNPSLCKKEGFQPNVKAKVSLRMEKVKIIETEKGKNCSSKNVEDGNQSPVSVTLSEAELFSICWKKNVGIHQYLDSLVTFLVNFSDVKVVEVNHKFSIVFPDRKLLEETLSLKAAEETNSVYKLRQGKQQVLLETVIFVANGLCCSASLSIAPVEG